MVPVDYIFLQGYGFSALFVNGLGYDSIPIGSGMRNISYLAFATSGAMTFIIIEAARMAGAALQRDKQTGMMKQIMLMPFSQFDYISAVVLTCLMTAFGGTLVLLGAGAPLLWNDVQYSFVGSLYMVAAIFEGCIIFASLSILLALFIKRGENYELTSTTLFMFLVPSISPTFYSLVPELPEAMKYAFLVDPMTHVLDIIRAGMFDQLSQTINIQVAAMAVLSAILFYFAVRGILSDRRNYEL